MPALTTGSKNTPKKLAVRHPPEIIERERSKDSGKVKAREPHTPLSTSTKTPGGNK